MIWYEKLFIYMTYCVYILYIIVFFHVSSAAPAYLSMINYFRQLFVGLMLITISNPLRKKMVYSEFNRKLIFTSSLFLLVPIFKSSYF